VTDGATLDALARLGEEAGVGWIAAETHALAERLAEGRFYVVCVGQFKRGKSTLLNALIGTSVLPTGVVPITAAVTVVRHGAQLAARVRFHDRDWEDCDPTALAIYVSEEYNPANEKAVYREAERRFVELVSAFQERLVTVPGLEGLLRLEPHGGLREKSHFQFTEMLRVAPTSASARVLDVLLPWRREQVVERDAVEYLARLLEVNSARLKNDFVERVVQSRRLLEREIRDRLQRLATSAERAFERARAAHIAGTAAVRARLDRIESVRRRAERVNQTVTAPAETAAHPPG